MIRSRSGIDQASMAVRTQATAKQIAARVI